MSELLVHQHAGHGSSRGTARHGHRLLGVLPSARGVQRVRARPRVLGRHLATTGADQRRTVRTPCRVRDRARRHGVVGV